MTGHLAEQSASGYACAFGKFKNFCETKGVDPFTSPPAIVVKFLRGKFESGVTYQTICYYRSAISKFHVGHGTETIGNHPLVKKAVRAAFRGRPPIPKYKKTYDISPVLSYIASLHPLESLNLKKLTFKTMFLLSFSSLSRVSSLARLRCDVEETQVITFCSASIVLL